MCDEREGGEKARWRGGGCYLLQSHLPLGVVHPRRRVPEAGTGTIEHQCFTSSCLHLGLLAMSCRQTGRGN